MSGASAPVAGGLDPRGASLRTFAAAAIGLLAVGRTLVMNAGQRYFDIDPSLDPLPIAAVGPAGSQLCDAALMLAAAVGVLGIARGGGWPAGRLARWSWLGLVPMAAVLWWHGGASMDDRWLGSSWIAAVAAGAVAWGLARETGPRAVLLAVLLAAMVPMAGRGLMQIRVGPWIGPEYARTLQEWMVQRQGFLADRGWAPDSPAARIFERRLLQPQPRGWFATTNIFATMAAATAVLSAGVALAAARTRAGAGVVALPAMIAAGSLGLLGFTGSKAAWAAMLLAGLVLVAGALAAARPSVAGRLRTAGGWLAVLVVPVVLGLVVLRGGLPEDFAGDRSLLFRWHYLQGATGTLAESPFGGVGADGFRGAYLRHRPLRSPEEVTSVHSVAADWLVAGGLAAAGWVAAMLVALWMLGRGCTRRSRPIDAADVADRAAAPGIGDAALAAGVGLAVAAGISVEAGRIDGAELLTRLIAVGLAAMAAVRLRRLLLDRGAAIPGVWFAAAGVLAVAHAQVEMTATQPNAAAWWAVFVATVAAAASGASSVPSPVTDTTGRPSAAAHAAAAVIAAGALAILFTGVRPAWRQDAVAADAAVRLAAAAERRMPVPSDERIAAAARLADAAAIAPPPRWVEPQQARQLVRGIVEADETAGRERAITAAAAWLDGRPPAAAEPVWGFRDRLDLLQVQWDAGREDAGEEAIAVARAARAADPHVTGIAMRLAGLLARAGRVAEAAAAAREALAIDAAKELDPAKQLAPRDRQRLERIAAADSAAQ